MKMQEFIEENRAEIDSVIDSVRNRGRKVPFSCELTDDDRRDWIANEPLLYSLARSCGVRV